MDFSLVEMKFAQQLQKNCVKETAVWSGVVDLENEKWLGAKLKHV